MPRSIYEDATPRLNLVELTKGMLKSSTRIQDMVILATRCIPPSSEDFSFPL
jgi:hypothetical protein